MLSLGLPIGQRPRPELPAGFSLGKTSAIAEEAPGDYWRRGTAGAGTHGLITAARFDPAERLRVECAPSALARSEYALAFGPFDSSLPAIGATPKRGLYLGYGNLMYWDAAQVIGLWPVAAGARIGLELGGGEVKVLLRGTAVFAVSAGSGALGFMAYIYNDDTALLGLAVSRGA